MNTIASERRKAARMEADYPVFLQSSLGPSECHSRDVSLQGMGLFASHALQPGDGVDLNIIIKGANLNFMVKGLVRHCAPQRAPAGASANYRLGVEFTAGHEGGLPFLEADHQESTFHVTASVMVDLDIDACYQLLSDITLFPQWVGGVESATVRTRYADGRAKQVEFTHNFLLRKVRYTDQFSYDDQNHGLSWTNVSTDLDFLKNVGGYTLKAQGPKKTLLTFAANITVSFMPSKRLVNYLGTILVRKEMKSFKQFAEKHGRA